MIVSTGKCANEFAKEEDGDFSMQNLYFLGFFP